MSPVYEVGSILTWTNVIHYSIQLGPALSGLVNAWNMGMIPIYQEPFPYIGMEEVNYSTENLFYRSPWPCKHFLHSNIWERYQYLGRIPKYEDGP